MIAFFSIRPLDFASRYRHFYRSLDLRDFLGFLESELSRIEAVMEHVLSNFLEILLSLSVWLDVLISKEIVYCSLLANYTSTVSFVR